MLKAILEMKSEGKGTSDLSTLCPSAPKKTNPEKDWVESVVDNVDNVHTCTYTGHRVNYLNVVVVQCLQQL